VLILTALSLVFALSFSGWADSDELSQIKAASSIYSLNAKPIHDEPFSIYHYYFRRL
jgi:hypothetical protein